MRINTPGKNKTELILREGLIVFFSYRTPVACINNGVAYKTNRKYSTTTTRHINDWLTENANSMVIEEQGQEYFDGLTFNR